MIRAEALALARRLAAGVQEPTQQEAVARLLERVANAEPEIRDALIELGALAVLRETWVDRLDDAAKRKEETDVNAAEA